MKMNNISYAHSFHVSKRKLILHIFEKWVLYN